MSVVDSEVKPTLAEVGEALQLSRERLLGWEQRLKVDSGITQVLVEEILSGEGNISLEVKVGGERSPSAAYTAYVSRDYGNDDELPAKRSDLTYSIALVREGPETSPHPHRANLTYDERTHTLRGVTFEWKLGENEVMFESLQMPPRRVWRLIKATAPGLLFEIPPELIGKPEPPKLGEDHGKIVLVSLALAEDCLFLEPGVLLTRARLLEKGAQSLVAAFKFRKGRLESWKADLGLDPDLLTVSYVNGQIPESRGKLALSRRPYYLFKCQPYRLPERLNPIPHLAGFGRVRVEFDALT